MGMGAGAGRMVGVGARVWEGTGYGFRGVRVEVTGREFEFSRRGVMVTAGRDDVKVAASNLAVAWTADGEVEEGLIGGVLQGRKTFDAKGASATSRRRMWAAAVEVAALLGNEGIGRELGKGTYDGVKEGPLLEGRRRVKAEVRDKALKGWLRNTGDGAFSL
jgi:tRNA-specific adenosine deaminase 1